MAIHRREEIAQKDKIILSKAYGMLDEGASPDEVKAELDMLEFFSM